MPRNAANPADRGPLLGALLRLSHQHFAGKILRGLAEAGYKDIQPAHFAVTQALWDHEDGLRLTDLAKRARITKQSMGELVDQLALRGYVERTADPGDGRARLVKLTALGRNAARRARQLVREIETDLSDRVGARRIEELRKTLRLIAELEPEIEPDAE